MKRIYVALPDIYTEKHVNTMISLCQHLAGALVAAKTEYTGQNAEEARYNGGVLLLMEYQDDASYVPDIFEVLQEADCMVVIRPDELDAEDPVKVAVTQLEDMAKDVLTDVKFVVYKQGGEKEYPVAERMAKQDLLVGMSESNYPMPDVNLNEELCLCYRHGDNSVTVSLCNKTSDVSDEHFGYGLCSYIVMESVRRDKDLVFNYNDRMLADAINGGNLTQEDYVRELDMK